ncbi:phosphoribosyltransferase [Devosia neptuniae]|uniref:Phosphoribosyltransferase n=1 Tax=Devosia neptuniae TaxID=191302 RepID=A0ABY6CHH8_9HYPH|nr:phosphoribosyltransferase [Devosia neptuniae]UXN71552.1 phosphoribosyltransferase [Devosia neptuniae]
MFATSALFTDRREAGRRLAKAVAALGLSDPIVLALPRGGVPVALEVALALRAPLDLLLVRKLGAPGHEEYGIGALVDGADPQIVLNDEAMAIIKPPPDYVEAETQRQLIELERRRKAYLGSRQALPVKGETVVIVDDGIATGSTITVALRALRKAGAAGVVLAVPVAPLDTIDRLREEADGVVCLATPEPFGSVGQHYVSFGQTSDQEVVDLLAAAAAGRHAG